MQRVKTSVIGWVERRIDSGITSAGESAKTFFVEGTYRVNTCVAISHYNYVTLEIFSAFFFFLLFLIIL
jgi:hypothetical protein